MDFKDNIFRIVVYLISIYLILNKTSILINTVGWIILVSHIFKDLSVSKNTFRWTKWCEYIGLLLAIILLATGLQTSNYFIVGLGVYKFIAHVRQLYFEDNRYYY